MEQCFCDFRKRGRAVARCSQIFESVFLKFPFHLVILSEFTKCPECFAFRKFNIFGFSRKLSMEFSAPFCPIPEVPESYATLYVILHMWYMYHTCISFLPLVEAFDCADAVNKRERTRITAVTARALRRWINTPAWCKSYYR